ncbi:Bnr asp-box repeat domain protein [Pleurostoma richardsiae]|uniref:Bnr asp-box repeat domain protein n=1 Tax=Pleurostoma richardsiae TaxID=41990 RepID=A0AA38RV13_9PEZI|nr:Bnr asp-box repeat domain protein [Pleurostoma richardsiae]
MMLLRALSCLASAAILLQSTPAKGAALNLPCKRSPEPFSDFTNNVVFTPAADYTSWKTIYPRTLQLPDGALLLTWEDYPPEPPLAHFPIWKSVDGGATWSDFVNVTDQVNGWGLRYQPLLYQLPTDFGGYKAGTILLAGMSLPADLSEAWLDLYASTDGGSNWDFVSHVVYAPGPETTTNGNKAVWEPFLLMYHGQLICYYSDQRDPAHAQKLAHVVTGDLRHWSDPVDDVADPTYTTRPGMAVVAHVESTGKYIMTYENCTSGCPAYYKIASSPLEFGSIEGEPILVDGATPGGSPYVIWTPDYTKNDGSGIIIMNGASREEVFVNDDVAAVDTWKMVDLGQWAAYSRCLEIIGDDGKKKLLLSNAGNMWSGADNYVVVGVADIPTY